MRTILLIVAAFLLQFSAVAQGIATATLHHGDEFKTFYSGTALRKALAEAQPGDIINLSAGSFKGGTISVPITLRGAGIGNMGDNSLGNSNRTTITEDLTVNVPENNDGFTLSMEGMECDRISIEASVNSTYSKLRIKNLSNQSSTSSKMENDTFVHCIFGNPIGLPNDADCHLYNCIIPGHSTIELTGISQLTLNNCLINLMSNYSADNDKIIYYNCIFNFSDRSDNLSSSKAYDCVAIGGNEDTFRNENAQTERNNRLFPEGMKVFKDETSYRLTDEAAAYLGADGTQVGIYGTSLPFSVKTSYPQITKFKVAPESTSDGKLKIEIEIDANN